MRFRDMTFAGITPMVLFPTPVMSMSHIHKFYVNPDIIINFDDKINYRLLNPDLAFEIYYDLKSAPYAASHDDFKCKIWVKM